MPEYFYTAKSFGNQTVSGILSAKNLGDLSKTLKSQGLFLVKAISKEKKAGRFFNFSAPSKVSSTEKIIFARNLSIMMETGLSLVKSFDILSNQAKSKRMKTVLSSAREKINKGEGIAEALANYPDIFSEFFLSMVRVGEESGKLEEVLKVLSAHLEKEHRLKSAVQGAMVYPAIILSLMIVVGITISIFVLPKIKKIFTELGANIPIYTRIMVDFGDFAIKYWPVLIIVPIVLVFIVVSAFKTKGGRIFADTIFLKIPLISSLVKKNNCAVLIRSLSSLLSSGVSLTESLQVSSGTVKNFYFKKAVVNALEKIKKGENLSESFIPYRDIFPYGVIEIIEVGEETGKTSLVLKTLADFYEEEVIRDTAKLLTAIEPILIIVMGVAVGLFAFSVIEPLYSSLGTIK